MSFEKVEFKKGTKLSRMQDKSWVRSLWRCLKEDPVPCVGLPSVGHAQHVSCLTDLKAQQNLWFNAT